MTPTEMRRKIALEMALAAGYGKQLSSDNSRKQAAERMVEAAKVIEEYLQGDVQ